MDEGLGRHVVFDRLKDAGLEVERHADHFQPGTPDSVWLPIVGQKGWIVLTKDDRFRYRATEKSAHLAAGGRALILTGGNLSGRELAESLIKGLAGIERLLRKQPAPFIASVSRTGAVRLIEPSKP